MALSCILRGASIKFRVSSLQSLIRSPILPCSSQFHNTHFSQSQLLSQKSVIEQNAPCIAPKVSGILLQNVKHFSVSSTNMAGQGHDHSKLWTVERGVAVGLLSLVPTAFLFPNALFDYILAVTIVMHNHWGWEAVVIDYVRPIVVGPVIPKIALASVYALSAATLAGLCFFIYNDVGLVNAIKMLWKL